MPIKRINSTGRKKILREDACIFLRSDADGVLTFNARLELAEYDLPAGALVFVEAYRQTMFMRFEHGTAASPQPAVGSSRRLTEFATRDGLLFRVTVTSTGERSGILLAKADKIPARDDEEQPDRRLPLLPPVPADLGQEVWRIEFSDDTGPQLLVNQNIGDWKAVASSFEFRSLVFPTAMRQVLWHVVWVHESRDTEDQDDWGCQWLLFAKSLPGVAELPASRPDDEFDSDEWSHWIESAVASFSRQHQMFNHYRTHLGTEVSE